TFNGQVTFRSGPFADSSTSMTGPITFNNAVTVQAGAAVTNAGVLTVNGTVTNGGSLTISGGTLAGTGTVTGGTLTVNASGTVSPGHSPGTLTLGGTVTLNGQYVWELNANTTAGPGVNYDQIVGTGTTTVGASSSLSVSLLAGVNLTDPFWSSPQTWTVLNQSSGTLSGSFGSVVNGNFAEGSFSTQTLGNAVLL